MTNYYKLKKDHGDGESYITRRARLSKRLTELDSLVLTNQPLMRDAVKQEVSSLRREIAVLDHLIKGE